MKKHGIIEESTSPWHCHVVMVKKPINERQFCVDYRKLNAVTETMSFPIPYMPHVFDTLAESQAEIFSMLDLHSGYWQVSLDKATIKAPQALQNTPPLLGAPSYFVRYIMPK